MILITILFFYGELKTTKKDYTNLYYEYKIQSRVEDSRCEISSPVTDSCVRRGKLLHFSDASTQEEEAVKQNSSVAINWQNDRS